MQQVGIAGVVPNQQLIQQGVLPNPQVMVNPLAQQQQQQQPQNGISLDDYKFIFNESSVGMAIASLGGAFVDCNPIFSQLSEYTKEEICTMTIFNVTNRQDLQNAFDLISQMISPTLEGNNSSSNATMGDKLQDDKSIVLRGNLKNRTDLGLSISLIKGEQGTAKCFCVTLVRILTMQNPRPDLVAIEMELPQVRQVKLQKVGFASSHTYTAG